MIKSFLQGAGLVLVIVACGAPGQDAGAARETRSASLFATEPSGTASLPKKLKEISGLALTPDGRLLAHDDERAVIREVNPRTGEVVKSFALGEPVEKGDFEGIAVAPDGEVFLISSLGRLYRFREAADGATAAFVAVDTGLGPICEVEGLAWRREPASLIVACKAMLTRSMRGTVALYAWSPATGALGDGPWRSWPAPDLARAAGVDTFHPSSLDFDPASGRMLLLAGREGAMVEMSPEGTVVAGRRLGAGHAQAEGVAVLPDGELVIADEATEGANAHITRYPRRP